MERVWIKASASSVGNCVEMAHWQAVGVLVRDGKNPDGPALSFTPAEFAAWLDGAKKGEFDHLI